MKIAITGKGGVGKTTCSSLIVQHLAKEGKRVIAVDADPDGNLAAALGFSNADKITPIAEMGKLIEERTGAKPGASGSFFSINPKVDDLPEKLWMEKDNIRLMVMGTVKKGGSGCVCPESALLKNLVSHLVLYRDDVVVLDMEAGIEHLGRGTSSGVDAFIVVVEPGRRSIETFLKIKELIKDFKLKQISVIGNKIRSENDENYIKESIGDVNLLGFLPFDENLIEADKKGSAAPAIFSDKLSSILKNINT